MSLASGPESSTEAPHTRFGRSSASVRDFAWAAVAFVIALLAAAAVFDAVWRLVVDGAILPLLSFPIAAIFCWWIGGGAWRRTVWGNRRADQSRRT